MELKCLYNVCQFILLFLGLIIHLMSNYRSANFVHTPTASVFTTSLVLLSSGQVKLSSRQIFVIINYV